MRIYVERAREFLGSRSLADFQNDELVQAAVVRCIEVIGEAATQVSDDTQHRTSEIPWQLIIGMRNVLAHYYGAVDFERIYRVVIEDLPQLLGCLAQLIAALERDVDWTDDDKS